MTIQEDIKQILSDGQWHCILDIIAETGLSARNRISEMNGDFRISLGLDYGAENRYDKYIGESCKLEKCFHKSNLYMYKLNPKYINSDRFVEDREKLVIVDQELKAEYDEQDKEIERWNSLSKEQRHEEIKSMMSKKGLL
jgi:hypothetical protein